MFHFSKSDTHFYDAISRLEGMGNLHQDFSLFLDLAQNLGLVTSKVGPWDVVREVSGPINFVGLQRNLTNKQSLYKTNGWKTNFCELR